MLDGGTGNDMLTGGAGADVLKGGSGTDEAIYTGSDKAVMVDLAAGTGMGGDAEGDTLTRIENVTGSNHDDTLYGDARKNALDGGEGADMLRGGAGADALDGGTNTAAITPDPDDDTTAAPEGDTVNYYDSTEGVTVDLSATAQSGGTAAGDTLTNIENVQGSKYGDMITGDGGRRTTCSAGWATTPSTAARANDMLRGHMGDDTSRRRGRRLDCAAARAPTSCTAALAPDGDATPTRATTPRATSATRA